MIENAIVLVLFNELPKDYIYNIKNALIIVVDNTPNRDLGFLGDNIVYIPNKDNLGIATALNKGFSVAIEKGIKWVLTMDQDSLMPSDMLDVFISFSKNCDPNVGLLSPVLKLYEGQEKEINESVVDINMALQSGSFINTKAYMTIGGFMDSLFIDSVDTEFCWNLKSNNYRILQLGNVIMQHQLGHTREYKIGQKHLFYITNHNYIRHYYMMRNSLFVSSKYPKISGGKKHFYSRSNIILFFKILFFESDKIRKLKAVYYGILDYHNGVLGRFNRIIK